MQRDQAQQCPGEGLDRPKELDSLRLKLQAAQEDLEATRASLTAAEKAAVDAEKTLHRLAALLDVNWCNRTRACDRV